MKPEYSKLVEHIPDHKDYPKAKLQINLPTTSTINPSEILKLINSDAIEKGWNADEISVVRTSGYIACKDCKKTMHIHVATPSHILCMNCDGKNINTTEAEVQIIKE